MMRFARILLFVVLSLSAMSVQAGEIHPALDARMAESSAGDLFKVIVHMSRQAPVAQLDQDLRVRRASRRERHREIVQALQVAGESQSDLIQHLDSQMRIGGVLGYTSHWISNLIVIKATVAEIEIIAARDDVRLIEPDFTPVLIEPMGDWVPASSDREIGITPGLVAIGADRVWYELGYTGLTRLIGSLDTGVDGAHPALTSRWRGNHAPWDECWLDVLEENTTSPVDLGGHGTHTCGTMTGVAPGDSIGVAWGAEWIACNAIDQGVSEDFDNDIIAAFEWFTDPDGDPATLDDVPDVIQNSWGVGEHLGYETCYSLWWDVIDNCEAAGVVTVWSAGNRGEDPETIGSPADRGTTLTNSFCVGAVDATNFDWPYPIAGFSSRGPTTCVVPPGHEIKPELVAPGVDVYSSIPGGIYGNNSGTSMSGPHVAGVAALMRQADPNLDVVTLKEILMATVQDEGDPGEDNTYGHGHLDAFAAVSMVIEGFGELHGQVVNASWGGVPLPGARLELVGDGYVFFTDDNGEFSGRAAPGSYTLRASMIGFAPQEFPILVTGDGSLVQDFALTDIAGPLITDVSEQITLPGGGHPDPITVNVLDYSTVNTVKLHFRLNQGSWTIAPMAWQSGDLYMRVLPQIPPNTSVDYFVEATDGLFQESVNPAGAPGEFYTLLGTEQVYVYDCENPDFNWRLGAVGDDATNGLWVRADPIGTEQSGVPVQPEDDHTPDPGVQCFVTGNGEPGGNAWGANVDNGCTTLRSPIFDISSAENAFVNYWRWFANILVTADDEFVADISADGGLSWVPLERVGLNANYWQRVFIDLDGVIPFTDQVVVRFVICDLNLPSLLEAAIDDFSVETFASTTTAAPGWNPQGDATTRLLLSHPNPWRPDGGDAVISFNLERRTELHLQVYDISGRLVRTLAEGTFLPGIHQLQWNGRDGQGHAVSSGIYFYRLQTGAKIMSKRVMLIR